MLRNYALELDLGQIFSNFEACLLVSGTSKSAWGAVHKKCLTEQFVEENNAATVAILRKKVLQITLVKTPDEDGRSAASVCKIRAVCRAKIAFW